jgi:hypothetical protein
LGSNLFGVWVFWRDFMPAGGSRRALAWCVDAALFLGEVEVPVGVEVVVGDEGAELEDCFG